MSIHEKLKVAAETRSKFLAALSSAKGELEHATPDIETREMLLDVAHDMTIVAALLKGFAVDIRARETSYSARDNKMN